LFLLHIERKGDMCLLRENTLQLRLNIMGYVSGGMFSRCIY
jgi:hypothetical protein